MLAIPHDDISKAPSSSKLDKSIEHESTEHRRLEAPPDYCDDFKFEFALNGKRATTGYRW
jgi:hypothetical protein